MEGILGDHARIGRTQYSKIIGPTKTGTDRIIDLPKSLIEKLKQHILDLRKKALAEGEKVTYLFCHLNYTVLYQAMRRACQRAGLRVRHPHDLRHTYASILLMDHYNVAYVQKQLGHSSIQMTVDTYGHWIPGEGRLNLDSTFDVDKKYPAWQKPWQNERF